LLLKFKDYVSGGFIVNRLALLRQRTHTGRPLGNAEFIQSLEGDGAAANATKARSPRNTRYGSKTR
jgi:hypothetical protein